MKQSLWILLLFQLFLLTEVKVAPGQQVTKNSVILDTLTELENSKRVVIAEESVHDGGIAIRDFHDDRRADESLPMLRELASPSGTFTFTRRGTTIEVKVLPMVARRDHTGKWHAASGKWDFKSPVFNRYERAVHVTMGGELDIAYQSSGLKIGEKDGIVHYGLSGNPHAISLSRKRLRHLIAEQDPWLVMKPILDYRPPEDTIVVQIKLTSEGLYFQPILDYEVRRPKDKLERGHSHEG